MVLVGLGERARKPRANFEWSPVDRGRRRARRGRCAPNADGLLIGASDLTQQPMTSPRWAEVRRRFFVRTAAAVVVTGAMGGAIGYSGGGTTAAAIAVVVIVGLYAIIFPRAYVRLRRRIDGEDIRAGRSGLSR